MSTSAQAATPKPARGSLTRRASLNALAALVDYAARVLIYLLLAPVLLRYLGPGGFGAWQLLQRLIGQATPAGGRPGEALKWVVAQEQSSDDDQRKRQHVGTAVAVWALFLPLILVIGAVLTWVSPHLVHAEPGDVGVVRLTAGLLVLNVVLMGLTNLPQSVLQGQNLGYRRLGLSTAVLAVGAVLTVLALKAGWGLVGVAAATFATTLLSGATFLTIVRSQVPWWGVARPARRAVRGFVGISGWFLLWNLVMQIIKGSDVIVLGAVGGVALVATYALTSYVPQAITDVVFLVISATMPGLGGLVGAGELDRAARVRGETLVLAWAVAVGAGATAIVWLPTFLGLWVGARFDAGTTSTVLICVMVLQLALIRVDSNVIDLTLRIRTKVLLGLASAALSVGLGLLLLGPVGLGIPGLVLGFILGRLPLTLAYPILVGRLLAVPVTGQFLRTWRPLLASVVLFAVATGLRDLTPAVGWLALVALAGLTAAAMWSLAYQLGLSRRQRRLVRTRIRKVVRLS